MPRTRRILSRLLLVAGLLAASGCLGDATKETEAAGSSKPRKHAPAKAKPSPSGSGQATGDESAAPAAEELPAASGTGLVTLLLSDTELPGFNERFTWREAGTGSEDDPVGVCQRFPMETIGAMKATIRRFDSPDSASAHATQVVARFPDAKTAQRATATLRGWHDQCADRLMDYDTADVGDLAGVTVPHGEARWYLTAYGPARGERDAGYLESLGILKYHRMLTVIEMTLVGEDFNYEGATPVETALSRVSERLG